MTRDELEKLLDDTLILSNPRIVPNDLMPDIDAYVEAEQERLAQAIEADIPDHHPPAWNREWVSGMRSGMSRAAAIVRSGGTERG